jgi:hypothetical protein
MTPIVSPSNPNSGSAGSPTRTSLRRGFRSPDRLSRRCSSPLLATYHDMERTAPRLPRAGAERLRRTSSRYPFPAGIARGGVSAAPGGRRAGIPSAATAVAARAAASSSPANVGDSELTARCCPLGCPARSCRSVNGGLEAGKQGRSARVRGQVGEEVDRAGLGSGRVRGGRVPKQGHTGLAGAGVAVSPAGEQEIRASRHDRRIR